jgi:YVTN family beta-propeller protein
VAAVTGLRAYVSNEDDGTVSVIDVDACRLDTAIPVGKRPRGLRLSPDGRSLFVAVSGSIKAPPGKEAPTKAADRSADGIALVDLTSKGVSAVLPGGQDPESFDVSADGRTLYVSNEETAETSVVDVNAKAITATVPVGREPEGVALRPDGKVVYVTSEGDREVAVIDTASRKVIAHIKTGARPRAIAFSPDGSRALITNESEGSVLVVDAQAHAPIKEIALPEDLAPPPDAGVDGGPAKTKPRPMGVVIDSEGRRGYVTTGWAGAVAVIDVGNAKLERAIGGVGARPWGIAMSRDGKTIAVANGPSHDVSIIDLANGDAVKRCKAGRSPWGIVLR